ncbi:hypothetical protein [Micromonospora sediminicola]|uniref:hypothetical protein n=1 Tax=Micromonospora sediminicola TaxID=946078 RepID=UPI0037AF57E1
MNAPAKPRPACEGPLVWFDAPPDSAVLECSVCGYVVVAGNFHDEAHADTPLIREGLTA